MYYIFLNISYRKKLKFGTQFINIKPGFWRGGLMLKNIWYTSRGPGFSSQHLYQVVHNSCNVNSKGFNSLLAFMDTCIHMVHLHTLKNIHIHIKE